MAPRFTLRRAQFDEIPAINEAAKAAFGNNPLRRKIWQKATDEELQTLADPWYVGRIQAGFNLPGIHCLLVVARDDETGTADEIAGMASWRQPLTEVDPSAGKTETELETARAALRATWPACVDIDAVDAFGASCRAAVNKGIGKDESNGMWALEVLAVHPKFQRKGVGSMLTRWGLEEAEKSGTDAYVIATEVGRKAYLHFGFEDACEFWNSVEDAWVMRWRHPGKKEVA